MANLSRDWPGLAGLTLDKGPHPEGTAKWCFQEAVVQYGFATYGEDFDPSVISVVLRRAGQRLNDAVGPTTRQLLKDTIPAVAATDQDDALEDKRAYKLLDGAVRRLAPGWIDFVEPSSSQAAALRSRPEITSAAQLTSAQTALRAPLLTMRSRYTPLQAVVGPPTSSAARAYQYVVDSGALSPLGASDIEGERMVRYSSNYIGNIDATTGYRDVMGEDASGEGGFTNTMGLVLIGLFREAVAIR